MFLLAFSIQLYIQGTAFVVRFITREESAVTANLYVLLYVFAGVSCRSLCVGSRNRFASQSVIGSMQSNGFAQGVPEKDLCIITFV